MMWFTSTAASKRLAKSVPSWSWLSTNKQVNIRNVYYCMPRHGTIAEILDLVTFPRSDLFGPVISGHPGVRAPLCQGKISRLCKPCEGRRRHPYDLAVSVTIGNNLLDKSFQLLLDGVPADDMDDSDAAIFHQTIYFLLCKAERENNEEGNDLGKR